MEKLIITPKTKIYDLLQEYPDLEETLIEASAEFRKLKNPVLRKTIARITNIGQAAVIANLNVEELVNRLRIKAGQDSITDYDESGTKYNTVRPDWFSKGAVVNSIDTREILNRGEQPVHEVMAAVRKLNGDEILEVIAPFIPAPLIDKTLSLDYHHWIDKINETEHRIYFKK